MAENIVIKNARVNNLKNVSVEIPRGKLVVVTGVSGSGKSSLAFDTLYAEGQRRFAESLSSYARQFLGRMSKPDVDIIEGIPPAIAIEQKVNTKNPRSTVATTTEIYDYLRLVYSRIGHIFSPISGREVKASSASDVLSSILDGNCSAAYILSDVDWDSRSDKVELMLRLKEEGYSRFFADGKIIRIEDMMQIAESGDYPKGLFLLIDRAKIPSEVDADLRSRLLNSIANAFDEGGGRMFTYRTDIDGTSRMDSFCNRLEMDGLVFKPSDEYIFNFNSPLGACPTCGGLGKIIGISEDMVIPDKSKNIYEGAIACWRGDKMGWFKTHLVEVAERYEINIFTPYCQLSKREKDIIWHGHSIDGDDGSIIGIDEFFDWVESQKYKVQFKFMLSRFSGKTECHSCGGSRLRKEALYVKVGGKTISELMDLNIDEALKFFEELKLDRSEREIAEKAIEEITYRLKCLQDVGLSYLTLSRACNTLSGGESQRINLVTALGSSLVGSLYILDEPSIGLHPRDTEKLISVLKRLRDMGNTVVVVEHDEEIIRAADLLIDMGPKAGSGGGEIIYKGEASAARQEDISKSLTLGYLSGDIKRYARTKRNWNYAVEINGAMQHNLKDIDVKFPLGVLTVVSGVSGSGKSSLVGDILYPALNRRINEIGELPGTFKGLKGNIDRLGGVDYVDQSPIGKSSRSNAVTYLKVYDDIRKLMASQQYSKINGFTQSFFSFNQEGGRCPECQGDGYVKIGMQFMSDVTMVCEACGGKRFKPEILEVRYKDKNINDILEMSVAEAISFFGSQSDQIAKDIARKLQPLADVGLSYIKLGQPGSTLSGGESQRIKLAYYLSKSIFDTDSRKRMMFIFDEPTTGLHFYDVEKLLKAFDVLLENGHTIVVVEHNADVIRNADWVIELGPEAGDGGGNLVFAGTPEEMISKRQTHTSKYL